MNDTPTGIEARVCEDIARRQQLGIRKYGTTLEDAGLDELALLQHAYEETLDQAVYLKGAIERRKRAPGKRVKNQRITNKKAKLGTTSASMIQFLPGDLVKTSAASEAVYEVVCIKPFPHGLMVGIYDEPPSKHVDFWNPKNLVLHKAAKRKATTKHDIK